MVLALGRLKISAAALALMAAAIFVDAALLACILAAAAAHEAGHGAALLIFKERVSELRVEPWGFEMSCAGTLSYGKEIVTAAAGPIASLLLAVLLSAAGRYFSAQILYFAAGVSFVFGIFNALPVLPLDGGRVLQNALALPLGPFAAERAVCVTSCVVIFVLLAGGMALLIKTRTNFTLLMAGAWLLISYCKRSGIGIKLRSKSKLKA